MARPGRFASVILLEDRTQKGETQEVEWGIVNTEMDEQLYL